MIKFLINRLVSFTPAFNGLEYIITTQKNSWFHLAATAAAVFLSIWLKLSNTDFAIILLAIGLVWVAECINTGIEATIDLVSPERNHLAKVAKDVSAAGVLCAAIISAIIGIFIFANPLLLKLKIIS
ncbi:MAG: diacylglycerol kinase family protein [Anaerolineae bacterium]|nr:diacylglycerol kinase family protein [Anaerolineae bacterium]